jgi:6-phosphogluconolactonase
VAAAAAAEFVRAATAAIAARGRFTVALAGGSTPRALYALLADPRAPHRAQVAWEQVHVFFGDERQVDPEHPDSNCRMATGTLLGHVPIPPEQVHRIRGENPDADRAAEEYEEILATEFRLGTGDRPRFDLVLLGMGADGHTASIFPGSAAARVTDRLAVGVHMPPPGHDRVTLTLPVFVAAATVVFMVTGQDKAPALGRVAAGHDLPAGRVRPADGALLWLVDHAAATALPAQGARTS